MSVAVPREGPDAASQSNPVPTLCEVGGADGSPVTTDCCELFGLLVEHGNDIVHIHAPDGTNRYMSPACRRLGYEPAELLGRSPYDLLHPEDAPRLAEAHRQALQTGRRQCMEYRFRCKDGSYR